MAGISVWNSVEFRAAISRQQNFHAVGLQRVAKTSVLVLIGAKSGKHWLPAAISKQGGEQVTLDQAGVTPDEILGFLEVLAPFHGIFLSRCRLFLQSSEYSFLFRPFHV